MKFSCLVCISLCLMEQLHTWHTSYLAYNAPHDKGVCHDPNPRSDFDVKVKVDFNEFFFV